MIAALPIDSRSLIRRMLPLMSLLLLFGGLPAGPWRCAEERACKTCAGAAVHDRCVDPDCSTSAQTLEGGCRSCCRYAAYPMHPRIASQGPSFPDLPAAAAPPRQVVQLFDFHSFT